MKSRILTVRDLKTHFFTYAGRVQALDGVHFYLEENETLGFVGETGSGKSVTSLSIIRLIQPPGRIIGGEICYKGENLLEKTEKEMRDIRGTEISMVFQDPTSSLNPVLTIGHQIAESFVYHQGLDKSKAKEKAIGLMNDLGLPYADSLYKSYPHEISGGMRQRAMIAIALSLNPKILICDEPTTNLDVTVQAEILDFIAKLKDKYNTSIIWISHNFGVIGQICKRVAVMYAGNIVEIGDISTVIGKAMHPYTRMLLACIPGMQREKEHIPTILGTVPDLVNPPTGCRFHPRCHECVDVCRDKKPQQTEIEPGHFVSCWQYEGGD